MSDPATDRRNIYWLVGFLALLPVVLTVVPGLPNVFGSGYLSRLFDDFLIFAVLAIALNIVFGHTDQLYLFLGGLAGVGAYTTTLLTETFGVTAWATLVVGSLLAGAIGLFVSWVAAKREFNVILISILTLNLQLALNETFVGARSLTGGTTGKPFPGLGLSGTADAIEAATPITIAAEMILYYILLVVLLAVLLFYVRLIDSKFGLAFDTIREDEVAAASIGVDVVWYKTVNGFMAATIIGFTGVLYAQRTSFILPGQFSFQGVDVLVLIMLIVGGLRTTLGPVVGAAVVVTLQESLQLTFGEWETAFFGGLLIVLFLYFRSGVVPALRQRLEERLRDRTGPAPEGGGS